MWFIIPGGPRELSWLQSPLTSRSRRRCGTWTNLGSDSGYGRFWFSNIILLHKCQLIFSFMTSGMTVCLRGFMQSHWILCWSNIRQKYWRISTLWDATAGKYFTYFTQKLSFSSIVASPPMRVNVKILIGHDFNILLFSLQSNIFCSSMTLKRFMIGHDAWWKNFF